VKRQKVAIAPGRELQGRTHLFRLLSSLYPVDFEAWSPAFSGDAALLWEGCPEEKEIIARGLDCLIIARPECAPVPLEKRSVKFTRAASLDDCFRGQAMVDEVIESFAPLRQRGGDEVVCTVDAQPYWISRRIGDADAAIVASGPPEVAEKHTVYQLFNRRGWLQMLPFFNFLKQLTRDENWEAPPIRACLMFDDPNLHWPTYGFIDLRKIVKHAREKNYHVSFAMIPMDSWFVNASVAALFRDNKDFISLCIHGNDHVYLELGAQMDAEYFTKMLAQGLRRIEGFEKKSGVTVSRVMVPPYGAFREIVANPMLNLGYEATCVSRASLTSWNKEKAWDPSFGHHVAEFVGNGLPIVPRHVMAPGHEGTYRLAAFLNQPIIPHGHHQDCAKGLELLDGCAASINGIGKIIWSDMATIARSNYLTRRNGDTLTVKMLSRRCRVAVDEDVKQIVVERPWMNGNTEKLVCHQQDRTISTGEIGRVSNAVPLPAKGPVELYAPSATTIDYREVKSPRFQLWPRARRVLSEVRDRVAPLKK
jgi:hypothetical protein